MEVVSTFKGTVRLNPKLKYPYGNLSQLYDQLDEGQKTTEFFVELQKKYKAR